MQQMGQQMMQQFPGALPQHLEQCLQQSGWNFDAAMALMRAMGAPAQ